MLLPSDCKSPPAHGASTMLPPEATASSLDSPDSTRSVGAEGMNKQTAGVADTTDGVAQLSLYPAHPKPAVHAVPAVPSEVHDQSAAQQRGPEAVKAAATLASGAVAGFAADAGMASGLWGGMKHVPASSTGTALLQQLLHHPLTKCALDLACTIENLGANSAMEYRLPVVWRLLYALVCRPSLSSARRAGLCCTCVVRFSQVTTFCWCKDKHAAFC